MRSDRPQDASPASPLGRVNPLELDPTVMFSGGERNYLFASEGGKQFRELSLVSGLDHPGDSRSVAILDYDRDGWPDLALANVNTPQLQLFRNRLGDRTDLPSRRTVALRFVGANQGPAATTGRACRDGYGAKATLVLPDARLVREHRAGEGLAAQNSRTLLVGLGAHDVVPELIVRWPSGREAVLRDVPAGALVTAYEDSTQAPGGRSFTVGDYGPRARSARAPQGRDAAPAGIAGAVLPGTGPRPRLALVTTMATWCQSCRGELPRLARLRAAFPEDELALYAVPVDPGDDAGKLARYVAELDPPYRLLGDLPRDQVVRFQRFLAGHTGGEVLPSATVLDRDGNVLFAGAGVPSVSDLRRWRRASRP